MKLGQHFLVDLNAIREILRFVDPDLRPLVEVGPGKGSITKFLEPDAVVEIDSELISQLKWTDPVLGDARYLPLRAVQIVSSLPYYITFDFLEEISGLSYVKKAVLVLQKDFVTKVLNYPTYISFLVNYSFDLQEGPVIPPSAFKPRPKVFSEVLVLNRKAVPSVTVLGFLKCISKYRNKSLSRAGRLCGVETHETKKVREFRPSQVYELLSAVGLNTS